MRVISDRRSLRRVMFTLVPLVMLAVGGLLLTSTQPAASQTIPLPLPEKTEEVDITPFLPSTYGLPDEVGGWKIMGVVSSQNTACRPVDFIEVIFLVRQPGENDILVPAETHQSLTDALASLKIPNARLAVASGPDANIETLARTTAQRNASMEKTGCIPFSLIPTPESMD